MFPSLLRTQKGRRSERTPLLAALRKLRHPDGDQSAPEDNDHAYDTARYDEDEDGDDHGFNRRDGPLLPVFSEFLDRLPIYSTTHAIRILVIQRCETTLSWDQLRSPQVSQFLVKPIQQQILADHFSRGTIYCLLLNCLQFRKEGNDNPGNVGISNTRALICELLATRLLKEFSTRELIDALSYDFDPLQGMAMPPVAGVTTPGSNWARQTQRSARVSTLEVAIRAQAKKFLAHPLVVQHLEAVWAGAIVFHSVADNLHRVPQISTSSKPCRTVKDDVSPGRGPSHRPPPEGPVHRSPAQSVGPLTRRTVTLYDPRDASLFKLSRLRVPRYRSLFSTVSFAIMLGLFLAVLSEKSDDITALEVLFWFWSAGYMLDEIVGWSEQGFGLYIMSVWNAFDLGILFMFMVYYVLRLYGILITDVERHHIARMAYDVLGATAVLLFPRLFSALDHYRYFSQLLIAFRMMAMDLVAILLLIIISCSGFFVAFTLAFKNDFAATNAAYALFQLLMGYTPAAWELWDEFNPLGKGLLTLFLFICHFLVVTILITVLTNSFMAVVQNANEEHQFLFAVNTISMVKSDTLFSYIPPTNIIGWLVIPLKYCMPFRQFVRMNRLMIKLSHVPILFLIFLYERLLLSNLAYEPTDLVERRGRSKFKVSGPAFSARGVTDLFSPGARLREPSITTFRKDRALEEVFRRPYRNPSTQATAYRFPERRQSSNVVTNWMEAMSNDADAVAPSEDTRSVLDRLEGRSRPAFRRARTAGYIPRRHQHPLAARRVVASDPDDVTLGFDRTIAEEDEPDVTIDDIPHQTDGDGDDELVTNSEEESRFSDASGREETPQQNKDHEGYHLSHESSEDEFFGTPMTAKPRSPASASPPSSFFHTAGNTSPNKAQSRSKSGHSRNLSTNTVLFSPTKESVEDPVRPRSPEFRPKTSTRSGSGNATPARLTSNGVRTPRRQSTAPLTGSRPRAILPPRGPDISRSSSNIAGFLSLAQGQRRRDPSFNAIALDLASDLGDNRHVPDFGALGGIPGSFTTQFEMATRANRKNGSEDDDENSRISRIMLARMTTLEEGLRDMLKEVKGLRKGSKRGDGSNADAGVGAVSTDGQSSPDQPGGNDRGEPHKRGRERDSGVERMGLSL